jgi:hypothetical protein
MIVRTIEIGVNDFVIALMFMITVYVALSFIYQSTLGDNVFAFLDIGRALSSVFMMTVGLFDFSLLGNDVQGLIFTIFMVLFFVYFLSYISAIIFIDTYRFNYINEGTNAD